MKMFVNVARLFRYRPVVYSKHEAGALVYFGHISSLILFLQIWPFGFNGSQSNSAVWDKSHMLGGGIFKKHLFKTFVKIRIILMN